MKLKFPLNAALAALFLLVFSFAAQAAEMQYIEREALKDAITSGQSDYIVLDVRKSADYEKGHIAGAESADVDPALGVLGDDAKGVENLKQALKKSCGNELGTGRKMVILCYSGAKYAQKATDLLVGIGADASTIYTLKGGYKAWTGDNSAEYQKLMVSGKEPGSAR